MLSGFSTTIEALSNRLRHPILGTYVVTWSAYNWDVWPHWFADTSAGLKVAMVRATVTSCDVMLPIAIAVIAVLIRPWLGWFVAWATCKADVSALRAMDGLRDERLKIRQSEHAMKIESLSIERSTLRQEVDELDSHMRHKTEELEQLRNSLSEARRQHLLEQDALEKLKSAGESQLAIICQSHFGIDITQHRDLQNQLRAVTELLNDARAKLSAHGLEWRQVS